MSARAAAEATGPAGGEVDWLASAAARLLRGADEQEVGVYLATGNASGARSTAFWARALRETVGLVAPGEFPATLASTVATDLARNLGLRGPNHTLVGGPEASAAAWDEATSDLASGLVERALVVRFDETEAGSARAVLLVLGTRDGIPAKQDHARDPILAAARSWRRTADEATNLEFSAERTGA